MPCGQCRSWFHLLPGEDDGQVSPADLSRGAAQLPQICHARLTANTLEQGWLAAP